MSEVPVPQRSPALWTTGHPPARKPAVDATGSPDAPIANGDRGTSDPTGPGADRCDDQVAEEKAAADSAADPSAAPEPSAEPPDQPRTPTELIARHQRGIWRYLRMLGCDPATADDLTQETFLRVLRRESFVQHNDTATAGYLRRTAYNLLVSRHRKLGRMHYRSDPDALDEQWNRWAGKDASGDLAVDALKECLGTLSERARLALRMRFDSEASRAEIGDALGITDHGARNLMQRAKKQLRRCVEEKLRQAE